MLEGCFCWQKWRMDFHASKSRDQSWKGKSSCSIRCQFCRLESTTWHRQTFQSEASPKLFRDGVRLRNWALDLFMICKHLGSWNLSQSWWEYICLLAYMIHICPYPSSLLKLSTFDMKLKFRQFLQIKVIKVLSSITVTWPVNSLTWSCSFLFLN